jgi:mono/diheme cytochrome c family protein
MTLKRVVQAVEILAALGAVVFVVMLFANEPSDTSAGGAAASDPGAAIYAASCAGCHGADGGGGLGPQLSDGNVVTAFPDAADEVTFVTDGEGSMPAFGSRLSPDQIQQVVDYTRTL